MGVAKFSRSSRQSSAKFNVYMSTTDDSLPSPAPLNLSATCTSPGAVVVAPPLGIDNQSCYCPPSSDTRQKNVVMRLVDVFGSVRPGSDLTTFQLPPQFNLPKSQLQCYAEQVYCCGQNFLEQCADGATPLDRFLAVLQWDISLTRPAPFAKAPYNPILGETHHVTAGDLNLIIEQVSHHPPISALYATNPKKKIEVVQWNKPLPRFCGRSVEVNLGGRRTLILKEHGETYEMTSPKLNFRLLPNIYSEWVGDTTVSCAESGLEAMLSFKARSFMSFRGSSNRVSGKITRTKTREVLYTLSGGWDEKIMLQSKTGENTVFFDAKVALSNLKTPVLKPQLQTVPVTESLVVWSKVTEGLWNQNWEAGRKAKTSVEEEQRALRKQRAKDGEVWKPKYFAQSAEGEWEWISKGHPVPEGPVIGHTN